MKYLQRNSKRKQKSRAKRLAREICDSFKYHSERVQEGGALSPDEFMQAEAYEPHEPQEIVLFKSKPFKARPITAAA